MFNIKRHHLIILAISLFALLSSVTITMADDSDAVSNLNATRNSDTSVALNWTNNASLPEGLDIQLTWFFIPEENENLERMSEHFDHFVLTKNFEKDRDKLIEWGEDPVLQYITVDSIDDPCFQAREPSGTTCDCHRDPRNNNVGWEPNDVCWIRDNHPDWFLRDADGDIIYSGYGGNNNPYVILDPGNPGWREFFLERIMYSQEELGWHGIFFDNVGEIFTAHTGNPVPLRDYPTDKSYQDAMVGFLSYLRSNYFGPEGRPMYANFSALWDRGPAYYRYLEQLDGVMDEYWAVTKDGYYPILSFEKRLEGAVRTQELGNTMMLVSQGSRDNYARQRFSLATYLLIATDQAFFRYTSAVQGGYDQIWLYDNYDTYLGDPEGSYYREGDKFYRDFTHGRVMVDPINHESSITANNLGIEVERSTDGGNTFSRIAQISPGASSYTDNNASGDVCYRVAYVNGGNSNYTNTACVDGNGGSDTPPPTSTPETPTSTPETPDTPNGSTTITAPTGTINTPDPTFSWTAIENASQYHLQVKDASDNEVLFTTVQSSECNNGTCTRATSLDLRDGTYSIFVRGFVNSVWAEWNSATFTVDRPSAELPTLTEPSNTDTLTPTLTWTAAQGATYYQLYVAPSDNPSAAAVQIWVLAEDVCNGNSCSYTIPEALQEGVEYSFYMQSWGPGGTSEGGAAGWAGPVIFTTPGGVETPGGETPVEFSVEIVDGRVIVVVPNDGTQWVQIYLGDRNGWTHLDWYQLTADICNGENCRVMTEAHPRNGSYISYVQTWHPVHGLSTGGIQGWYGSFDFNINLQAPGVVDGLSKNESMGDPTFGWDEEPGATWYQLQVVTASGEIAMEQWFSSIEALCHGGSDSDRCRVAPDIDLGAGEYKWSVRAWGPGGFGPNNDGENWAPSQTFNN